MLSYLLVALGSAVGGVARYGVAVLISPRLPLSFPLATLVVNVLGCFILSLINETALLGIGLRPGMRLLLTTGFCGGFTTYSTFNHETARLFEERAFGIASLYFMSTVLLCFAVHLLGVTAARLLVRH